MLPESITQVIDGKEACAACGYTYADKMYVCICVYVCMYVCVCVYERETDFEELAPMIVGVGKSEI